MDTELLRTFLEVRNTRHFGKAAENLFLTQAAVSARIRQLEGLLGVRLFIRSRNNIQLSSDGERLVSHAETVLLAWSRARQELALETSQSTQLHIGIRHGLWNDVLQATLQQQQQERSEVALRLESHDLDTLVKMLLDRTLDIALVYDEPAIAELKRVQVGHLSLQLLCTHPSMSLAKALERNYAYVDWGGAFGRFHARHFPDAPAPALRTNTGVLARDYILGQGGAAYLPATMATGGRGRQLRPLAKAPGFRRKLNVIYRANSDRLGLLDGVAKVLQGLEI